MAGIEPLGPKFSIGLFVRIGKLVNRTFRIRQVSPNLSIL